MKRFLLVGAVALQLLSGAWAESTPQAKTCRHIVLLDISGSLRTRGYATRQGWTPVLPQFMSKLFSVDEVMSPGSDDVQICPFSDAASDAKEKRHPVGPFTISSFKDHIVDLPAPGSGATDMPRALDMGKDLAAAASGKSRSLVWLITDNENNMQSSQTDQEFYRRLRDSQDYSHVMFFPLANPKVRPGDNLVMYLLAPKGQWETLELEKIAQAVAKKTGYDGLLFRPLYTAPGASALDFSKELSVEGRQQHKVTQEGGTTVLHFQEGEKLDGRLKFKIRSRLKGWKLQKAHLEDAEVKMEIPATYSKKGAQTTKWQVTPKELTVEPQKETAEFFLLHLTGPEGKQLLLQRTTAEQLTSPFVTRLPEVRGKVTMRAIVDLAADGIKTEIPAAMRERLTAVQGLAEIEHFMVLQDDSSGNNSSKTQREILWERQLVIRVAADPTPAYMLTALAGLFGLAMAGVLAAIFLMKRRLKVEGPGVEEEVSLSYLVGSYLICDKDGAALFTLRCRMGSLSLVAEPDHLLNGEQLRLEVRWEGDEFRFECTPDGKPPLVFWLHRDRHSSQNQEASGSVL